LSDIEQLASGVRRAAVARGHDRPTAQQVRHLADRRHRRRSVLAATVAAAVVLLAVAAAVPAVAGRGRVTEPGTRSWGPGLPGTLYYLTPGIAGPWGQVVDTVTLSSRTGSAPPVVLGTYATHASQLFEITLTVSPDGRRLAWADPTGAIITSLVDGSGQREIATSQTALSEPDPQMCARPMWTADSTHLVYSNGPSLDNIVNRDGTGDHVTALPRACDLALLSDGQHAAWTRPGTTIEDNFIVVTDLNTGAVVEHQTSLNVTQLVAISPDARRAVVALFPEGPGFTIGQPKKRGVNNGVLLDVDSGQQIPTPVPGRITAAIFQPDGTLLLRTVYQGTSTLSLVRPDGTITTHITEPPDLARDSVIAYVP
jgi:TolB protein